MTNSKVNEKLEAALEYAKAGLPVFPCYGIIDRKCECGGSVDGCSPGKHPRIGGGLHNATTDLATITNWWLRWPNANIAIIFEGTGLCAIDIDRKEDVDGYLWLEAFEDQLPSCPRQITPSGGMHLILKVPEGETVRNSQDKLARGVDVRGDGGYIMAAPSDHAAGSSYYWEDSPVEFDPPLMPTWLVELIGANVQRSSLPGGEKWRVSNEMDESKRAEILDALQYIDPETRHTWLRVGMAIHSEFAHEGGLDLWDEWSAKSDKFDPKTQRYTWDKLDSFGGVHLSAIFAMAEENGWTNTARGRSISEPLEDLEVDLELKPWEQPDEMRTLPPHLIEDARVGALGLFLNWSSQTARIDQPILSLAAAITMFGTVFGRFFECNGTRTNIFALGVAASGAGKENARQCCKRLLESASLEHYLGAEDFASGAALYKEMKESSKRLFLLDEFGKVMAKIVSAKANSAEIDIGDSFLRIYNGASDNKVRGKARATAEREDLSQPHACIYGCSTPSFYDSLTGSVAIDGLMSRFLVFDVPAQKKYAENRNPLSSTNPPQNLISCIDRVNEWQIKKQGEAGNLAHVAMAGIQPKIIQLEMTEEAQSIIFDTMTDQIAEAREKTGEQFGDIWARAKEQTTKLAMIRALCAWLPKDLDSNPIPIVSVDDVTWAKDVVLWCVSRLVVEVQARSAESKHEANLKRIIKSIQDLHVKGKPWITKSELTRKTQHLTKSEREQCLQTAIETGQVEAEKDGRKTIFRATTVIEDE